MKDHEPMAWDGLHQEAARRLKPDFAERVLAGAARQQRQSRVQNLLMLTTALACFLSINLCHWISASRVHEANLAQWQEYLEQTETLQTAL